ncbi:cysteine dioxygenase family protein [Roseomonas marmotae]|uniref:Cysteine dioxygenase family protein n=2 Tax=Roseomonas marmotae TaxID=2768161 RepID=A0ABS3KAL2_9PROT|nr:cysteine dioxygenase family protein [Roseomonas marmotae]QTI80937.1 cysteine dioxygenase family protein [Roseomonas marmotae]
MLNDIEDAVTAGGHDRPRRIAAALQPYLGRPDLLPLEVRRSCPQGYIRHLLHANPKQHYAVVALVWRPGQMSPVHAHLTWCALGVHHGVLTEGFYEPPEGNELPRHKECRLQPVGSTSHGPADLHLIHRLANLGSSEAISIHVYGADFDRFGQEVNHIF